MPELVGVGVTDNYSPELGGLGVTNNLYMYCNTIC